MIGLQNSNLESLLKKANEYEKKYEWLQATEYYKKASSLALAKEDVLKVAEIQEKLGYCYFRRALQAQKPEQNKLNLNHAIKAFEKSVGMIEQISIQFKQAMLNHKLAWIFLLKSWREEDLLKRRKLLNNWWNLERQNLSIYDEIENPLSYGKVCVTLIEHSAADRFFVTTDNILFYPIDRKRYPFFKFQ